MLRVLVCINPQLDQFPENATDMATKKRRTRAPSAIERDESDLPSDVVYDILTRSPVKSLLRFRSVSHPWRYTVSEPEFVQNHLIRSTQLDRQKILVRGYINGNDDCRFIYSVDYQNGIPVFSAEGTLLFPLKKDRLPWSLVIGSYNGLVLLGFEEKQPFLALWNPSTRVYKYFSVRYPRIKRSTLTGISYDSSPEDYKAVFGNISKDDRMFLEIYSFRQGYSQSIQGLPYYAERRSQGVTVDGVLHWVMRTEAEDYDSRLRVIVYYDSAEHNVKEMMLPAECYEKDFDTDVYLANMKGCLCMYYYDWMYDQFAVWMMKDFHVVESWTRVISFTDVPGVHYSFKPRPLFFTSNGSLVVATRKNRLIIYDPMKKKLKKHKIQIPGAVLERFEATFYDSLVQPKIGKMSTAKHR